MSFRKNLRTRRHLVAALLGAGLAAGTLVVSLVSPVRAQTTTVSVQFSVTPPAGSTLDALPLGAQTAAVVLTNTAATPLTNTQVVIRMPAPPAFITSVSDGLGAVGAIDNRSGVWYHTLALIPANGQVSLTVSWQMTCPGRWPLATRVGTVKAARFLTWVGPANPACGPDDIASPNPQSYYDLLWPPSTVPSVVSTSSTTVVGATTTTVFGSVVATTTPLGSSTTSSTIAGTSSSTSIIAATTSTTLLSLLTTTTANIQPVTPTVPPSTVGPPTTFVIPTTVVIPTTAVISTTTTTRTAAVAQTLGSVPIVTTTLGTLLAVTPTSAPPLIDITDPTVGKTTVTIKKSTTAKKTTTKKKSTVKIGSSPTTTVIICKTIGNVRYCGPSSSAYKPGQKKVIQSKPKTSTKD